MATSSRIRNFYAGQNVLVTGATGFLGIVLVEKLLRSFPEVGKIYAIVRKRPTESLNDRKQMFFNEKIFSKAVLQNRDKVVFIEGDIEKTKLGISEENINLILDKVNVVFHCAATIKFTERLNIALRQNVFGTQELLRLFESSNKLKCFMHVSSVFANFDTKLRVSEERVYPAKYTVEELTRLANSNPRDKEKEKLILGDFPNTYILTKNISEHAVLGHGGRWPAGIFRAPILTATYSEPIVNYTSIVAMMKVLQDIHEGFEYDLVEELNSNSSPVDMAACGLLAAARDAVCSYNGEVKVYNYSNYFNRFSYGNVLKCYFGNKSAKKVEKTEAHKLQQKRVYECFQAFMQTYYECPSANMEQVWEDMSEEDRQLLPFSFRGINWQNYYSNMYDNLVRKQI